MAAGETSRSFPIERGVKQGVRISALLFIAVMGTIFHKLKAKWHASNRRRKGQNVGLVIDDIADPLANLRFADDGLFVASCKADIKMIIVDLKGEAKIFGLTYIRARQMC